MILRVGELLGLPPDVPDPGRDVALLRYLLLLLAVLWAALAARGRPALGLVAGTAFVILALGFWIVPLGRPYGLLVDPAITRRGAEMALAAAAGRPGDGVLVDEPATSGVWAEVAPRVVPPSLLLVLPTLGPLLVLPAMGLLVYALWPNRTQADVAAFLCLLFSTGELETVRGLGFVPGLWTHPGDSFFVLFAVLCVLAVGRSFRREWTASAVAAVLCGLWIVFSGPDSGLGPIETLWLLTLDQFPWFLLALWGLKEGAAPAARALMLSGGALVLFAAVGGDPWTGQALYRLGLILAAVGPVSHVAAVTGRLLSRIPRLAGSSPQRLGVAGLLLVSAPSSFIAWWSPYRLDPVMEASRETVAQALVKAMDWVRTETPSRAVFLASPEYSPGVAVLGGRRVLRAPTLAVAEDDDRRDRAEDKVLRGRDPGRLAELYGLTHVFIAPGDFLSFGIGSPEDLEKRGRFRLLYRDAVDFRVYEIVVIEQGGASGAPP